MSVVACTQDVMAHSVDSGNGSLPPPPTESTYVSLPDTSDDSFDTFEDVFGLAVDIDWPGNDILRDYLQILPALEHRAAVIVHNTYENGRICTFEELLSVNLDELKHVTIQALSSLVYNYFHIY